MIAAIRLLPNKILSIWQTKPKHTVFFHLQINPFVSIGTTNCSVAIAGSHLQDNDSVLGLFRSLLTFIFMDARCSYDSEVFVLMDSRAQRSLERDRQ